MAGSWRVEPHGDAALLVTFGDRIDPDVNRRVHAAAAAVRLARLAGAMWSAPVPAYASLLVGYDARLTDLAGAEAAFSELIAAADPEHAAADLDAPAIEIAVRYGGTDGPDLDEVAERCRLTPAQVVQAHASIVYRAYMLGFSPGFAYLGELPAELELPRRDTPRQRVPAGSVAIAGRQTAVYPQSTPGGWHLIGRTEAVMWDADRSRPATIEAGAMVRFVARA